MRIGLGIGMMVKAAMGSIFTGLIKNQRNAFIKNFDVIIKNATAIYDNGDYDPIADVSRSISSDSSQLIKDYTT